MHNRGDVATVSTVPRIIIFGAGAAGRAAHRNLSGSYEIVAFCDNGYQRLPKTVQGLPVLSPQQLVNTQADKILIASEYFEQIRHQLLNVLGWPPERVNVVPATLMKAVHFGTNQQVSEMAVHILHLVTGALEKSSIRHYVDAGTLLGIYRDNALIPWDDDLDIAIDAQHLHATLACVTACLDDLHSMTGVRWMLTSYTAENTFGAVKEGDIRSLKLSPTEGEHALPMMDFFVKYVDGERMDYTLSSRGIRMPSHHLLHTQLWSFRGEVVRLPADVEDYLQRHYGDWRTPKKDWNLSELKSATVF